MSARILTGGDEAATRGLVLIHGRGDSAQGIAGLVPVLGAAERRIAAPEAPGNSWWPTSFLAPMAEMEPWVARGLDAVDAAIAATGLPKEAVALAGFSQGACLALEYAARRGQGLPAVIAFSGGLVGSADAEGEVYGFAEKALDYAGDLTGTHILVTCHERDPHIPLSRAEKSVAALRGLGAEARLIAHPGPGHQPMPDGIKAARAVLA
ncbi:alpha/beta hydrolase [Jannaschia seohaensis]|uniref:Phospholipase/carboxylesterase/glyoxalase family protein n=1 Tax=Jannaschia seohaensis TaxID=475081 RepID=A0A2Y9B0D1_9RHOB|nr:dienelactone hydrolase family protein [Jannaschia seohaensis]PWJ17003.1 phospholipase/carboxylesterase/glyoxalase family protein [Jannaschia seohaensis]SSA48327.1 phospholipase/carboxylesterase/glyoxalase family protein [Jannaschia seohaensis]